MIINLPLSIYDNLKSDKNFQKQFKKSVSDKVKENYNELKKNKPKAIIFKYILEKDVDEILLGNIVNNTNYKFIDDYRKTVTFAEVDFLERVKTYRSLKNYKSFDDSQILKRYYNHYKNPFLLDVLKKSEIELLNSITTFKDFNNIRKKLQKNLEQINEDIINIFLYYKEYICDTKLREKILHASKISVCPYCNRQYTTPFFIDGKEKIQADLEHFYPKSKYPLFSLSIMNYIPSCLFCNRNLKGQKIFDHLYFICDDTNKKIVFKDKYEDYDQLIGNSESLISLDINKLGNNEILKIIDLHYFNSIYYIDEIYNSHNEFLRELKQKKAIYNMEHMDKIFKKIQVDIEAIDINNFIYGYNGSEEELLKKPLSKLVQDIIILKN